MSQLHHLKIWPLYYERVRDGSKTWELRENDRGFKEGDTVLLHEWSVALGKYTGQEPLKFIVGYVLKIDQTRVVFSLLPYKEEE